MLVRIRHFERLCLRAVFSMSGKKWIDHRLIDECSTETPRSNIIFFRRRQFSGKATYQRMQIRITLVGKRIPLKLSISIRPGTEHRNLPDRLAEFRLSDRTGTHGFFINVAFSKNINDRLTIAEVATS